ncbi:MAG: hypothetical protein LBV00_12705 [Propionibacteriaceae bacterium]|jgi:filamentous hemagglutinin|nr:hypothetical protein [Propionibacteriaceae bacterium]
MAVVSVNVEALRTVISTLKTARVSARGSAQDLIRILSQADTWVSELSSWTSGEADAWIGSTITYLQRRLDYAELLLTASGNTSLVVTFDASVLAQMDVAGVSADARAAVQAIAEGDVSALEAIMAKYCVETAEGLVFYDPQFASVFASSVSPSRVADMLVGLDGSESLDLAWFDGLLTDLAGMLAAGVTAMGDTDRRHVIASWAAVTNESSYVTVDASRREVEIPTKTPRIQALSLLLARGDWPGSFLSGVADGIRAREGEEGVEYWLGDGVGVRDPAVVDPETGQPVMVTDPVYGVWQAAVCYPEWFVATYMGDTVNVDFVSSGRNDPTDMFDTSSADVASALNDVFHRGFDQASYSALMSAVMAADIYRMMNGDEPIVMDQAQTIAKAMLLEDYRDPKLPVWVHAALDAISMIPVADCLADGLNAVFYWFEGDKANAALSAGAILIPGVFDLSGKAIRWGKKIYEFSQFVSDGFKPSGLMADLIASGAKFTPEDVIAITRTPKGNLVWLESGDKNSGLRQILNDHGGQFLTQGIAPHEVSDYIMTAVSQGRIIGVQGKGATPRTVYEFEYRGITRQVAIQVGSNGYIVGANPTSI